MKPSRLGRDGLIYSKVSFFIFPAARLADAAYGLYYA